MIRVQSLGRGGDSKGSLFYWFMNTQALIGRKIDQTQGFLEDGTRVPLSVISVAGNVVTQLKTQGKEGYNSIQLGFGMAKHVNKPMAGHIKKAGTEQAPRFFREIRVDELPDLVSGTTIAANEVFEVGDIVDIEGTSKGKGFAGVVKRHGFAGGPRTHGQSDRERAPGSIGQTTTPGRVYRGKRMAGRMGAATVTIKNLEVLDVSGDTILVRGLVPGVKGNIVVLTKVGKNKKFVPLYSEHSEDSEGSEVQKVGSSESQEETVQTEQGSESTDKNTTEEGSNQKQVSEAAVDHSGEPKEENAG